MQAGYNHLQSSLPDTYIIANTTVAELTEIIIAEHSLNNNFAEQEQIVANFLVINRGIFNSRYNSLSFPAVEVIQQDGDVITICTCLQPKNKLCEHKAKVLLQLINKTDFRVFFDAQLRQQHLKKFAADYGLQDEPDLSQYFELVYVNQAAVIKPIQTGLFPVTPFSLKDIKDDMLPDTGPIVPSHNDAALQRIVVFKQHKYYKHLVLELCEAGITQESKVKNPVNKLNPLEEVWDTNDPLELKFYTAISRFENKVEGKISNAAIEGLKAVVKNPLGLACYVHNGEVSDKTTASALSQVKISKVSNDIELKVDQSGMFYEVSGTLQIGTVKYKLAELDIVLDYFIKVHETLYLVKDIQMLGVINFFKRRKGNLVVHQSKYDQLQKQVLSNLEERVKVDYTYIKPATTSQLKEQGFAAETEKIIYLSDFGQHVMIIPIMRYGEVEIPIRTQKQIHSMDSKGKYFLVKRNEEAEGRFMALLLKQHQYFEEQITDDLQYFYLHKKRFLDENWFLRAFENWHKAGVTILGFNEISGNKLNGNKAKVSVQVKSGINWFNTIITARFGKQKASLKHLHKAIRNKSKFVQLDDGTLGILPDEWMLKFNEYFAAAEVVDEMLYTPKVNYTSIVQLYEDAMLDAEVSDELRNYHKKLSNFSQVANVTVPEGLQTTLRGYQQQGLNWLNFLDEFNFGGCLADDMGLGKTVQVIAFILSQNDKVERNTNLIVVPTSLLFNWQAEVARFAPSLKIHTLYGADRLKNTDGFEDYEIILTSYGTLLSDINFLKSFEFNYVFLDESQNIKNPNSQRYKAARLLKSRNRIAITGTPIENNTFDLYSQLSFACPGLLGSKQYFKDIYSTPIDQFKVSKRSLELQNKIKPFILRRTKQEVASELPEKTEMVLYCEMQDEQRKIYDAYEKEFREFVSATSNDELPKSSMHVLKGLTKLRQICDSPLLLSGEKLPGKESAKIDVLVEQILNKSPEHKILVFSQFVSMLNLLAKELDKSNIGYAKLTGTTRNRQAVVDDFQNNTDTRVFLVSLKAGGTGLNLTAADYVYIVDPWWNPAIENQAIDRAYRIGQQKHVVAVRLICPDTIEEKIIILQETKRNLSGHLLQQDGSFFKSLTRTDLLDLLKYP
ncbi:DEAD/DEAH box helicase [Mucilaginibacter terrae]|nr:DEAD/DEAH box helicase [Mucilaginibacter terrae]